MRTMTNTWMLWAALTACDPSGERSDGLATAKPSGGPAVVWDVEAKPKTTQAKLLIELTEGQEKLVGVLREGDCRVDEISLKAEMPMSTVASELLQLEFEGVVRCLPGKVYTLI